MAKRNVVDFKIINLSEEKFQELKEAGQIDPNALYTTPDTTKERLDTLEGRATNLEETKQDEATAVNYDNITNCITHIPQDIKLELADGVLTLKAGSKVYVPNGFEADGVKPKFDVITTTNDIQINSIENRSWVIAYNVDDDSYFINYVDNTTSGAGGPTAGLYGFYYNTTTNSLYDYRNAVQNKKCSFPICIATSNASGFQRIDVVNNGFGYIGSTKYVLPGVKGLIPNGKNADESLRNIEFTTSSVMVFTGASTDSVIGYFNDTTIGNYRASSIIYNKELNRNINTITGDVVDMIPYTNIYHQTAGKIDYCTFKQVFHAVDYSDTEFIGHQATPSNKYLPLTIGAAGSSYIAPADGYFVCVISGAGYVELQNPITELSSSANVASGGWGRAFLHVSKGQQIIINYGNNPTFQHFRFVYDNGAK